MRALCLAKREAPRSSRSRSGAYRTGSWLLPIPPRLSDPAGGYAAGSLKSSLAARESVVTMAVLPMRAAPRTDGELHYRTIAAKILHAQWWFPKSQAHRAHGHSHEVAVSAILERDDFLQ